MSLRKEFLEVATVWAQIAEHPEKEKELLSDYVKSHTEKAISAILYKATEIGNLFKDASSIESAVDIGETSEKLLPKICESEKQKQSGPLAKPVCDIVKSTLIGNKTLQQGIQEVANVFGINVNDISQNRSFEATIERCTTAETPPSQSQGQNEKSTDKDSI